MDQDASAPSGTALFALFEQFITGEQGLDERFCPICFLSGPSLLRGNSPDIPKLQREHHGLWSACMRWLTAPWTYDQKTNLRAALRRNIDNCPSYTSTQHDSLLSSLGKTHITDPLELFQILLCFALHNCLYGIDSSTGSTVTVVARARNPRKRFRSKKGAWPTEVEQLLPYGAEATVRALVDACSLFADDSPLWVLNAVLHLARPRVWSALLDPSNLFAIVHPLIMVILSAIKPISELPAINATVNWRDAAWLHDGQALHAAAEFFTTILSGPYAQPDDILQFLAPKLDMVREAYGLAEVQWHTARPYREDWWKITVALSSASPVAGAARELVSDAEVLRSLETKPRGAVILGIIRHALTAFTRHCAGPGCTHTMLDDTPLPTCARCKVARYCIKHCQRADWTSGSPIPHRRLCPVLATMHAVADPELPQVEYVRRIRQSVIPDDYLVLAGRWALSRGAYFMDHVRVEIALPLLCDGREALRTELFDHLA
ncbi:hypothetical protein AURDEDRAFT_175722 [Auricularia subglabra TFB-10046 SS5]|uniref:MYND-type domain-containing protein n=1 Tax=Auricularia subglabra (strain TFB-10046 / SS5) TaxID=717982 RepID=J0LEG1_AURST|nr:hypothetical protein AURDEDRAFT_175722 [Auricularia subglabra TFB-10046 SS5]